MNDARTTQEDDLTTVQDSGEAEDARIDKALAEIAENVLVDGEESVFTRQELEVLDLYSELKELELEQAVLIAETEMGSDSAAMELEDQEAALKAAQADLLDARASYQMRENVVDSVLQADPILKAVHMGTNTTPSERILHSLIGRRDVLAMCSSSLSDALSATMDALTLAESENLGVMDENRELAASLFQLSDQLKEHNLDEVGDASLLETVKAAEAEAREAQRQYRFIKGIVGGVIAASGIDWSQDESLRDLVLDVEE